MKTSIALFLFLLVGFLKAFELLNLVEEAGFGWPLFWAIAFTVAIKFHFADRSKKKRIQIQHKNAPAAAA